MPQVWPKKSIKASQLVEVQKRNKDERKEENYYKNCYRS
jgi:hypothetical protein